MPSLNFPVNPIREQLYGPLDLYNRFEPDNELTLVDQLDFKIYKDFIDQGGPLPKTYYSGMMRSLHDYSIWNCVQDAVNSSAKGTVAIMGGHRLERKAGGSYEKVARISYHLAKEGYLMISGGGPGAMEATHLGAYFSKFPEQNLDYAIKRLSSVPVLPHDLGKLYAGGQPDEAVVKELHRWLKPCFELLRDFPDGGQSLSIPTWHYGHEPATPFATKVAKYYQNSIREDGLLAIASHGVIYAEGRAGTLQEIFQDAAQNYYKTFQWFSPMIFLDRKYWTETYPVNHILDNLFIQQDKEQYLLYTDDIKEAIAFVRNFKPSRHMI